MDRRSSGPKVRLLASAFGRTTRSKAGTGEKRSSQRGSSWPAAAGAAAPDAPPLAQAVEDPASASARTSAGTTIRRPRRPLGPLTNTLHHGRHGLLDREIRAVDEQSVVGLPQRRDRP